MKKQLTRFMATALSVAMVAANPLTCLAETDVYDDNASAHGAILAYDYDEFVVPTTLKIALNPQELDVVTRPGLDDNEDGDYGDNNDIEPLTSNSQIVSFSYGVANLSSTAKNLTVDVLVEGWEADANKIKLATTAAAAQEGTDYSLYLALVGNQNTKEGAVVTNNVKKMTGIGVAAAPSNFEIADADFGTGLANFSLALSDVEITGAANPAVFKFNTVDGEVLMSATKTFDELYSATYGTVDPYAVDWTTTQAQLNDVNQNVMELDALGGIAGFTFTGAMNAAVDWTELTTEEFVFTPVYTFTDLNEELAGDFNVECVFENNTYNIILPDGVVIDNIAAIDDVTVHGNDIANYTLTNNGTVVTINRSNVVDAMGNEWNQVAELAFTVTVGNAHFNAVIAKQ